MAAAQLARQTASGEERSVHARRAFRRDLEFGDGERLWHGALMPEFMIELLPREEQTEFNLRRWREVSADPVWQAWEGCIETDRNGTILMSPPANFNHADFASQISALLTSLLEGGRAYHECPISTADGVRAADVVWLSARRKKTLRDVCLTGAPEICVGVLSAGNTWREMAEKKALYFLAGAAEVWHCDGNGRMTFFTSSTSAGEEKSLFCPRFPSLVGLD